MGVAAHGVCIKGPNDFYENRHCIMEVAEGTAAEYSRHPGIVSRVVVLFIRHFVAMATESKHRGWAAVKTRRRR